jgi:hypothetical protein
MDKEIIIRIKSNYGFNRITISLDEPLINLKKKI